MYVAFDQLPESSRIWIYQSNKELTNDQLVMISERIHDFINDWSAHNSPLKASFNLYHDRFLVIGVDETYCQLSGCSIDKSTKIIENLEADLGITFFDRFQVAFREGDMVKGCSLTEFKKMVKEGNLNINKTKVFDNMVSSKKDLLEAWEKPIKKSWHYQYVK
jgi:hypothetical protein